MGIDDLISTESAVVAGITAAAFSPRTRETVRRGAVLGVAGALKVGDVMTGAARGVTRGVRGQEQTPGTGSGSSSGSRSRRSSASSRSGSSSGGSRSGSSSGGSSRSSGSGSGSGGSRSGSSS